MTERIDTNKTSDIKAPAGFYKLSGKLLRETDKAILFVSELINDVPYEEEDVQEDWFPLSQTKSILRCPVDTNEPDVLIVSEWIAKIKGLV